MARSKTGKKKGTYHGFKSKKLNAFGIDFSHGCGQDKDLCSVQR